MNTQNRVKFLGGTAEGDDLTGSCIMMTIQQAQGSVRLLIDAGLIQCGPKDQAIKNREILKQLNPAEVDAIILTHAHMDHVGRTPLLVKHGFGGAENSNARIFCTHATASILPVMLEDSAKIQLENSLAAKKSMVAREKRANKVRGSRDRMTLGKHDKLKKKRQAQEFASQLALVEEPLNSMEDVDKTRTLIKNGGFEYYKWVKISASIAVKFYPSGHVLGGAISVVRIEKDEGFTYFGFSGDLGRKDGIILPPPAMVEEPLDYWFIESTYGADTHPSRDEELAKLLKLVKEARRFKKKIIMPSFALERAQEIIYLLSYYMQQGEAPRIPIFLDAPMATRITSIFADYWDEGMFAGQERLAFNPFRSSENKYFFIVENPFDSVALVKEPGPNIVIAGAGMCEHGRVRDHLRVGLAKSDVSVCLVGYMAKNSLGRKLKEGELRVKMNKKEIIIKAQTICFDSFSAHADQPFLIEYTKAIIDKHSTENGLKKIFIVHGEKTSSDELKKKLLENLTDQDYWEENIMIPKLNQEVVCN